MKKMLFVILITNLFFNLIQAQSTPAKPLTAEEKAAIKQKQEADLAAAYKEAGISEELAVKIKAIESSYSIKGKELYAWRDSNLNSINGKEAIKKFNDLLKKKKETDPAVNPQVPQSAEEKAALKKKQEEDKIAAQKESGFTDAQIEKFNSIMNDFKDKSTSLTKEKNTAVEEIAGKESIKKLKDIQKKQKEEAAKAQLPK